MKKIYVFFDTSTSPASAVHYIHMRLRRKAQIKIRRAFIDQRSTPAVCWDTIANEYRIQLVDITDDEEQNVYMALRQSVQFEIEINRPDIVCIVSDDSRFRSLVRALVARGIETIGVICERTRDNYIEDCNWAMYTARFTRNFYNDAKRLALKYIDATFKSKDNRSIPISDIIESVEENFACFLVHQTGNPTAYEFITAVCEDRYDVDQENVSLKKI